MKRFLYIACSLLIMFISCDEAKDLLNFKKAPVIDEIIIFPQSATVNPGDTLYLEVKASNPEEGVLTYEWNVNPGKGTFIPPSADQPVVHWIAPVEGGIYTFKVEVSNEDKSTDSEKKATVLDLVNPVVGILSPVAGQYFVQNYPIDIEVESFHRNGIDRVKLFVNDELKMEKSGSSSNDYHFIFTTDTSYHHLTEIKVEATAKIVATTGRDSVLINVEGILPGK